MASAKVILIISGIVLYQAFILAYTDTADGSIAMNSIIRFFDGYRPVVPIYLFVAAGGAIVAVLMPGLHDNLRTLLLFPQQFTLFVYAAGALGAIMRESYADDVLRTWAFISTDQLFLVGIFVMHTMSISQVRRQ